LYYRSEKTMHLIAVISSIFGISFLSVMLINIWIFSFWICDISEVHSTSCRKFRRNKIPIHLEEQMLSHLFMKYRTDLEGVQQQEIIDSLPKAIRSSISYYLFYSMMDNVYLFKGVSKDLIFQLVIFSFWLSFDLV
jgi:hypothetical protein